MKINLSLNIYWRTALLLSCLAYTCILPAQHLAADTADNAITIRNAVNAYHQYVFPETNLYNGSEYVDYAYTIHEGIPFFETSRFSLGTVEYDNMVYRQVPLLFDEVKEAVIIQDVSGRNKIQLNTEKVTGFSLLNHQFVKLLPDSSGKLYMRPGFYDVLYRGNIRVYKKQTKTVQESITMTEGLKRRIDEQNVFFIKKGSTFYNVRNKRDVLNITKDRKKEIQQYIKRNRLNVRREKDKALPQIAAYYDQLTNK